MPLIHHFQGCIAVTESFGGNRQIVMKIQYFDRLVCAKQHIAIRSLDSTLKNYLYVILPQSIMPSNQINA